MVILKNLAEEESDGNVQLQLWEQLKFDFVFVTHGILLCT